MIQWFRGRIEACYVGVPITAAALQRPGAEHFKPRVYRALVRDVTPIDPPGEGPSENAGSASAGMCFHAARVDSTVISGVRGPGTSFEGPAFDLRIEDASWSRGVRKGERSYGIVTGNVVGYCELPPPPPEPEVETRVVSAEGEAAPEQLVGELRQPAAIGSDSKSNAADAPGAKTVHASPLNDDPLDEDALDEDDSADAPARAKPKQQDSAALPLFSTAAAIAIALWVNSGGAAALLFSVFLLPTLIARKLFHGILRDSNGIRGFGLALMVVQLFCASTLLSAWWSADCHPLQLVPLLGIVVVIFPSGLLPSALPLCFNAAGLALVLGVWAGGGTHCPGSAPKPPAAPNAAPSVEHPGVPRTNSDGSWPRRPPG
jgi:hypothetical protein